VSYLDILLLAILSGEPAHGYEIRRKVERILSGAVSMNPNVLYPALHRFEAMGALDKTVEPQQGRPPRHVYRLTGPGHEVLHDLLVDFGPAEAASEAEFKTRVAHFHLIGQPDRLAILQAREAALDAMLDRQRGFAEAEVPGTWAATVLAQTIQQNELERSWVRELGQRIRADAGPPAAQRPAR
jgi:DNA-binding PadR family transcriptional regulator